MTVPTGVLVVVNEYCDGIYAQVWVRPHVSVCVYVCVYVCVSLYDLRVHVRFYIATYIRICS